MIINSLLNFQAETHTIYFFLHQMIAIVHQHQEIFLFKLNLNPKKQLKESFSDHIIPTTSKVLKSLQMKQKFIQPMELKNSK